MMVAVSRNGEQREGRKEEYYETLMPNAERVRERESLIYIGQLILAALVYHPFFFFVYHTYSILKKKNIYIYTFRSLNSSFKGSQLSIFSAAAAATAFFSQRNEIIIQPSYWQESTGKLLTAFYNLFFPSRSIHFSLCVSNQLLYL